MQHLNFRAVVDTRISDRFAAARRRLVRGSCDGPAAEVHAVMDSLYELGGRGILVTDILACRL